MKNICLLTVMFLIVLWVISEKKRKNAAVINHRLNHKKEILKMKALAERFIGKDCIVYTISSSFEAVRGTVKEVTDGGLLIDSKGILKAVNLEYITQIEELPKKSKKKNSVN